MSAPVAKLAEPFREIYAALEMFHRWGFPDEYVSINLRIPGKVAITVVQFDRDFTLQIADAPADMDQESFGNLVRHFEEELRARLYSHAELHEFFRTSKVLANADMIARQLKARGFVLNPVGPDREVDA